jgi:hypothetical protein
MILALAVLVRKGLTVQAPESNNLMDPIALVTPKHSRTPDDEIFPSPTTEVLDVDINEDTNVLLSKIDSDVPTAIAKNIIEAFKKLDFKNEDYMSFKYLIPDEGAPLELHNFVDLKDDRYYETQIFENAANEKHGIIKRRSETLCSKGKILTTIEDKEYIEEISAGCKEYALILNNQTIPSIFSRFVDNLNNYGHKIVTQEENYNKLGKNGKKYNFTITKKNMANDLKSVSQSIVLDQNNNNIIELQTSDENRYQENLHFYDISFNDQEIKNLLDLVMNKYNLK